jgi:hypothetical protein
MQTSSGGIDAWFGFRDRGGSFILSEPEASRMGEWRDPRMLPALPRRSCEEIYPTGILKCGGFSTPQDENAVLLRSK